MLPPLTLFLIDCINSWANRILSLILLPLTKPTCSGDIMCGKTLDILDISNFEMILLHTLHRLMGLKCLKLVGLSIFGIGRILVLVHAFVNSPPAKNSLIAANKSSLIISQHIV